MSLSRRIGKLEDAIRAKTGGGMALFDADGNEVEAEIVQEPQQGKDGLALLNGKQVPVELQDSDSVVVYYDFEPQHKDRLFLRRRDTVVVRVITAIPRPEDETE